MITPKFSCEQNEKSLILRIYVPAVRVSRFVRFTPTTGCGRGGDFKQSADRTFINIVAKVVTSDSLTFAQERLPIFQCMSRIRCSHCT